jgi:hypothetical protein
VAANPLKWRVSFRIHCAKIKGKKSLKEKEASVKQIADLFSGLCKAQK